MFKKHTAQIVLKLTLLVSHDDMIFYFMHVMLDLISQ